MSVYLIDGYNLLHQIVGHRDDRRRRSGTAGATGRPAGKAGRPPGTAARADEETRPSEKAESIVALDDERRRLLDRIASFMGGTSDRAIVVFDSQAGSLQKYGTATAQVEVYFGSFSQSADSIIEREVFALTPGENVIVVSSDHELQKTVSRHDVIRRSSRQFAAELQEDTKRIANRQNCITMSHRVEERVPASTMERLARLRDGLLEDASCREDQGDSDGGPAPGP